MIEKLVGFPNKIVKQPEGTHNKLLIHPPLRWEGYRYLVKFEFPLENTVFCLSFELKLLGFLWVQGFRLRVFGAFRA